MRQCNPTDIGRKDVHYLSTISPIHRVLLFVYWTTVMFDFSHFALPLLVWILVFRPMISDTSPLHHGFEHFQFCSSASCEIDTSEHLRWPITLVYRNHAPIVGFLVVPGGCSLCCCYDLLFGDGSTTQPEGIHCNPALILDLRLLQATTTHPHTTTAQCVHSCDNWQSVFSLPSGRTQIRAARNIAGSKTTTVTRCVKAEQERYFAHANTIQLAGLGCGKESRQFKPLP